MHDLKNILIAWISSTTAVFSAIEAKTLISIISAVVLPIIFFSIGKAVDVMVQIYLRNRDKSKEQRQDHDTEN
ncbi:MAG: hypothetical protein H7070_15720 [Saprospiraceae bacterium]|nr:hypothetical protein [Pyrinomonadaceae bacterium]